jgi:hypothetical protein
MLSLDGAAEWLNSEPLGRAELPDRVVLVNFWTLMCTSCCPLGPAARGLVDLVRGGAGTLPRDGQADSGRLQVAQRNRHHREV